MPVDKFDHFINRAGVPVSQRVSQIMKKFNAGTGLLIWDVKQVLIGVSISPKLCHAIYRPKLCVIRIRDGFAELVNILWSSSPEIMVLFAQGLLHLFSIPLNKGNSLDFKQREEHLQLRLPDLCINSRYAFFANQAEDTICKRKDTF